jgi:hypothetical protein
MLQVTTPGPGRIDDSMMGFPHLLTSGLAPAGPALRSDLAELLRRARAHPELAWNPSTDIAEGRNAHRTNLRAELAIALQGPYNWLEGDVQMGADGTPVMQHSVGDPVDLGVRDWLAVAAASGRGTKLDVKDPKALPGVIAAVLASGIPQGRLIINVGAWSTELLRSIRRVLPDVIVNISPAADADLTPADLVQLQLAARIVGGRIMFPVRDDLVTADVVHALAPYGRIAVWNTPGITNPGPTRADRLRELGVDGMIDLRNPEGMVEHLQAFVVGGTAKLLGWNAVHAALDALDLL